MVFLFACALGGQPSFWLASPSINVTHGSFQLDAQKLWQRLVSRLKMEMPGF